MQSNFILTDVMKSGFHMDLQEFIGMHSMKDQTFECTGEYYALHNYDLDSYDRRFAIIDTRKGNAYINDNPEYHKELQRRCDLLHSQPMGEYRVHGYHSSISYNRYQTRIMDR
jgi:hypothetical protein